jgi:hypothetical protein
MMPTKLIVDEYTKSKMSEYIGLTLVPKYWHRDNEDLIYCECLEDSQLDGYIFYLFLENCNIETDLGFGVEV